MGARNPGLLTREFALVFAITFITFFAAFQLFPTVPLRLLHLGASIAESGRFMTAFTAGSSLGALVTGPLGDRMGQRRMVVLAAAGYGAILGLYGLLHVRWAFYALAFPHGVVWSGLLTATMATLGRVLPPERRADGMSLYGLASPSGVIVGPVVGLALYGRIGFPIMVAFLAALFLVLALLALSLPRDTTATGSHPTLGLPDRTMAVPCLILFATALGYGALGTYTAQEAIRQNFPPILGVLPTQAAFLSCMAMGMVGMRILMTRRGFGSEPKRLLPGMVTAAASGLALLALLPGGAPRHAVSALLYGGGYSMVHTLVNAHALDVTRPERRGAAFGALLFAFDSGIGIGSFLIGSVIGLGCAHLGAQGYRVGWAAAAMLAFAALPLSRRLAKAS